MLQYLSFPIATHIAWTLVHFLWQGTLLGVFAWACLWMLRRSQPQVRYVAACVLLAVCALLPLCTLLYLSLAAPLAASPAVSYLVLSEWQERMQPLLPWVVGCWAGGAIVFGARTLGGWFWLQRLKRNASVFQSDLSECLECLVRDMGMTRTVRFFESVQIESPMAMGVFRPIILLPLGFFSNLDPVMIDAVLAHELAHIRRFDVVVNGVQCLIETFLFFHPAVWWISQRIRTEREHCCDDAAVQVCGDPVFFVEGLTHLDALRAYSPMLAAAIREGNMMERVRRLLGAYPSGIRISAPSLWLVVLFLMGSSAMLARPDRLQRVFVEMPREAINSGSVVLHRASEETSGLVQGLQHWGVSPDRSPRPPKILASRQQAIDFHLASLPELPSSDRPMLPDMTLPISVPVMEPSRNHSHVKPLALMPASHSRSSVSERVGTPVDVWSENISHIESATLPLGDYSMYIPQGTNYNAHRLLKVRVLPGEKLIFNLQGEDSKIIMQALPGLVSSPQSWRMAVNRADFPPCQARASRFEIQNTTSEPQILNLMLYGMHGYFYRIDLNREMVAAPDGSV